VLSSATTCLWKSFRRSRTQFRDRPETVRLHPGTGVHLHPGILFGINPERRSESSRNRVHLAPDSPSRSKLTISPTRCRRTPSLVRTSLYSVRTSSVTSQTKVPCSSQSRRNEALGFSTVRPDLNPATPATTTEVSTTPLDCFSRRANRYLRQFALLGTKAANCLCHLRLAYV